MTDLQTVLNRSVENASPFTRSLFEKSQWDAARVATFVNEQHGLTVATVSKDGEPHAAVVIAGFLDGAIHFTVSPRSVLLRNLKRSGRVAFSVCGGEHNVMGQGTAVVAARSLDDPELIERLAAASSVGKFTPPGWDGFIYRIDVDRIFAN
jgi:nitroimidazol reductase NimA-like FMN-containing flavoprotein (pyridoxamine 5'-phosphate oxidase superfamily)